MEGTEGFADQIKRAGADGAAFQIAGGATKSFLGDIPDGLQLLSTRDHVGVLDYHPAELSIRVKSGTPVGVLKETLMAEGQMLAFEPPVHGPGSTIGGVVSAGLSGSGRPFRGAARDHLLGVGMVLHDGSYVEFGGQVMKNVAGYDVSRLVCGAYGTLGLIADLSLKVIPAPEQEMTVSLDCSLASARDHIQLLMKKVSPLSASCYSGETLTVRLSGSEQAVNATLKTLSGAPADNAFWSQLDAQSLPVFQQAADIWRLSTTPDEAMTDDQFAMLDWGFAQRWLLDPASNPREGYKGPGHWTRVRSSDQSFSAASFQPLSALEAVLHQRIKSAFDPRGIFNPGRMYPEEQH